MVEREYANARYTPGEKEEFIIRVSIILADSGIIPIVTAPMPGLSSAAQRANIQIITWDATTTVVALKDY